MKPEYIRETMKPEGRKIINFPNKRDCHPKKGYVNWWENIGKMISRKTRKQKTAADVASKVTKEKCNGCKWLIEFSEHEVSCLNSRLCINYSEWKEKL